MNRASVYHSKRFSKLQMDLVPYGMKEGLFSTWGRMIKCELRFRINARIKEPCMRGWTVTYLDVPVHIKQKVNAQMSLFQKPENWNPIVFSHAEMRYNPKQPIFVNNEPVLGEL
jgi:hypothetical protein